MRILIEFLCDENIENITPFLYSDFDRVYFIGFDEDGVNGRRAEVLDTVVSGKFGAEAVFIAVSDKTLSAAYRLLYEMIGESNEYVIDLTGGHELFSAAAGILAGTSDKKNVAIASYDIENGVEHIQYPELTDNKPVSGLSVDEMISLSGGAVISKSKTSAEIRSEDRLRNEISRMWDTVKGVTADWNRFCSMTNRREGGHVTKKLTRGDDRKTCERLIPLLRKRGIIKNDTIYVDEKGRTYLEYDLCPRAKTTEMYEKSGTVLELYSCLAAVECGAFSDAASGVMIDLDGLITKRKGDPRNEIDLTAVYKNRLVLCSCKCTKPTKEHLYEILTMAEQYGGKYAVPVLICSEQAFEHVKERAREMGVILIDNVLNTSLKSLKSSLLKYFPV
jgi:hypothetical protein